MKILQVIPTLEAGGAEGFVTNLGVSLAALGFEVSFFLMAGVRGERGQVLLSRLCDAGVKVFGATEHNVRSPMNIFRLAWIIRSWRPDIVQANMYQAEVLITTARILTAGAGTSYVRRLANTEQVGSRLPVIVRLMDRCFKKTIACSPAVAKAYLDFMGSKHKSELITISNGGLLQEGTTTAEEKRQAREKLAIPSHIFVVAHIGRMFGGVGGKCLEADQKAHDVLLKAFERAFAGNSGCLLVLVGDGPLRPEAEELARVLGIATQVLFLGQQPEPWPVLKAADMFFFPSRYEGLPNVLPEAGSCGLPLLASDIQEISSLSPGDAWLLKPVDDVNAFAEGLQKIFENIELYKVRADKSAADIRKRFSMRTCAKEYMRVFLEK